MRNNFGNYRFRRLLKERDKLSNYLKYVSIITPLLIFFGLAKLFFFYSEFNINIIYFLSLSEIITEFFDFLIIHAFTLALFGILAICARLIRFGNQQKRKKRELIVAVFAFVIGITLGIITTAFNVKANYMVTFLSSVILFMAFVLISLKIQLIKGAYLQIMFAISVAGFILIYLVIIAKIDAYSIKSLGRYTNVKVAFTDSLQKDTDTYIGNTNNYIFMYNNLSNSTKVHKMADVKTIEFGEFPPKEVIVVRQIEN